LAAAAALLPLQIMQLEAVGEEVNFLQGALSLREDPVQMALVVVHQKGPEMEMRDFLKAAVVEVNLLILAPIWV